METRNVLKEAYDLVFGARQTAYDHPRILAERFAAMMNAVYGLRKFGTERAFEERDYAIVMLIVKLARESGKHARDNVVDIAGYAEVLARIEGDDE